MADRFTLIKRWREQWDRTAHSDGVAERLCAGNADWLIGEVERQADAIQDLKVSDSYARARVAELEQIVRAFLGDADGPRLSYGEWAELVERARRTLGAATPAGGGHG